MLQSMNGLIKGYQRV